MPATSGLDAHRRLLDIRRATEAVVKDARGLHEYGRPNYRRLTVMLLLIVLMFFWVVCGALTYGVTLAYFWHSWPTLRSNAMWAQHCGFAVLMAILGPIGLLVSFLNSGFAYHGLLYRKPKEESDGKK